MLNRRVNLVVWRRSPSKTEAKAVFVIQAETAPVGQTCISRKLEFITPCKALLLAGSHDREAVAQGWLLSCSNSGPQPRLARVVSSGSVCTGTGTAGQRNLLRLQPEWAMRGCWHSQPVSSRKLPLSLNYMTCLTFPFPTLCPLKTGASLITDKGNEIPKADHPHTLSLVCYFLSTPAEQRRGRGARSAPAGDRHSSISLTNY